MRRGTKQWMVLGATFAVMSAIVVSALAGSAGAAAKAHCNKSNPIKIGELMSLTGFGATIGSQTNQGVLIQRDDLNAHGGVLGRCVEIVTVDDGSDATRAAQQARQLVSDSSIKFVVGPVISGPSGVALPIFQSAGVLSANVSSFADAGNPAKYPLAFHAEVTTNAQIGSTIPYLKKHKITKVAMLLPNTAQGPQLLASAQLYFSRNRIELTKATMVNPGTSDMTPQVSALKATGAQALYMLQSADADNLAGYKAALQLNWTPPTFVQIPFTNSGVLGNFTPAQVKSVYIEGVYKGMLFPPGDRSGAPPAPALRYSKLYGVYLKQKKLSVSIIQSASGYDNLGMLANAIKATKSLDPNKVKAYLETHPYKGIRGTFRFTANSHDGVASNQLGVAAVGSRSDRGAFEQVS